MLDSVWQSILDKGGLGGAVALALFFVLSGVILKLWNKIEELQKSSVKIQMDCDEKIRLVYERQVTTMMDLITTVNRVIDKNSAELAENTRVVESRAEAIRTLSENQLQTRVLMDILKNQQDSLKDTFARVEKNQGHIMDGVAGRAVSFPSRSGS